MIINGQRLLKAAPIQDMLHTKEREHGVSHGLAEAGYDIRLKQNVRFFPNYDQAICVSVDHATHEKKNFTIASAIEKFQMPSHLLGVVHDKSTWARQGLSVFNTVIEPGWEGYLTLELVYHGREPLNLPAGCGIAQILFHEVIETAAYDGKYQNQSDEPVESVFEASPLKP